MTSTIQTLIQSARVPFLVLAPVSVFLGTSTAYVSHDDIRVLHVVLIIIAAVLAHISVNAFNEYMDYRSGLDLKTKRTPFSGGSGGLVKNPNAVNSVLAMAAVTLFLASVIGLYFIYLRGFELLWLGLIGVLLVLTYTPWINQSPILCWLAPGLGFGPVMVIGTHIALVGELNTLVILASIIPFLLVNNLLLLNQFPDIEADRASGRRHIPIIYGKTVSLALYSAGICGAIITILVGCSIGLFPWLCAFALVPLAVGLTIAAGLKPLLQKSAESWIPFLGRNVVVTLITPVIFSITLLIG